MQNKLYKKNTNVDSDVISIKLIHFGFVQISTDILTNNNNLLLKYSYERKQYILAADKFRNITKLN